MVFGGAKCIRFFEFPKLRATTTSYFSLNLLTSLAFFHFLLDLILLSLFPLGSSRNLVKSRQKLIWTKAERFSSLFYNPRFLLCLISMTPIVELNLALFFWINHCPAALEHHWIDFCLSRTLLKKSILIFGPNLKIYFLNPCFMRNTLSAGDFRF